MSPESFGSSSTTYRSQVPFGAIPSKVDRFTCPEGVGAGAEKSSGLPRWFAGL
jgi:hypothetical protein